MLKVGMRIKKSNGANSKKREKSPKPEFRILKGYQKTIRIGY